MEEVFVNKNRYFIKRFSIVIGRQKNNIEKYKEAIRIYFYIKRKDFSNSYYNGTELQIIKNDIQNSIYKTVNDKYSLVLKNNKK